MTTQGHFIVPDTNVINTEYYSELIVAYNPQYVPVIVQL